MNQEKLGKFLVTLRKEKGLTQKEVAKYIGVTEQAISKWERGIGIPDVSLWNSIIEVFDISIVELLQGEREEEKEENKKAEGMLQETLKRTNSKISKMKSKEVLLLIVLSLAIYALSLFLKLKWVNVLLFLGASLMVIYFLGILFRKWSYSKRFLIILFVIFAIILGYSYLEKLSILSGYREPIFSIKEIYKEHKVTLYNSFFYNAYSCDFAHDEISILNENGIETVCANNKLFGGNVVLKSGATISEDQLEVLKKFRNELLNLGFVDYNYMRQEDLNIFWKHLDATQYCQNLSPDMSNSVVKRKDGVCQYDNPEYYYCMTRSEDGTLIYTKADDGTCD